MVSFRFDDKKVGVLNILKFFYSFSRRKVFLGDRTIEDVWDQDRFLIYDTAGEVFFNTDAINSRNFYLQLFELGPWDATMTFRVQPLISAMTLQVYFYKGTPQLNRS